MLSNLYFINGNETYSGSVIRVDSGALTIKNSTFNKNGGENRQALIQVKNANLTLLDSIFENNTATLTGTSYGNIYVSGGNLYVDNCSFINNNNKYGVFYISGANGEIYNSNFKDNRGTSSSGGSGAGIYITGSSMGASNVKMENVSFINNSAGSGTYYEGKGEHYI